MNKTLLVIAPGRGSGEAVYNLLVAETGEHLASHVCSSHAFAPNDLYFARDDRKEEYAQQFGEVDIRFINDTDITGDVLIERNKQFYEAHFNAAQEEQQ
jgi:hypothetical protein